jgi:hypothetical protein
MKLNKTPCYIGLRTATTEEIQEMIADFTSQGLKVNHKTKGLPFNGILQVTKTR